MNVSRTGEFGPSSSSCIPAPNVVEGNAQSIGLGGSSLVVVGSVVVVAVVAAALVAGALSLDPPLSPSSAVSPAVSSPVPPRPASGLQANNAPANANVGHPPDRMRRGYRGASAREKHRPRQETLPALAGERGVTQRRRAAEKWSLPKVAAALSTLLFSLVGCPSTDVGAPCVHGPIVPTEPAVTFPALACNDLLCVYADKEDPDPDPCTSHEECNLNTAPGEQKFVCENGSCRLDQRYVLSRSMCSKKCSSDSDCDNGDKGTECQTGFACARIQSLGEFCCEKLCVCRDDLAEATSNQLDEACAAGEVDGCCNQDIRPASCGP